jgi:nucleotide-binding universal stress UspA family protein
VVALGEMPSIERILFPVDFSERCAQTAPLVDMWAAHFHAKVTLLHSVVLTPAVTDRFDGGIYQAMQPAIHKAAEESLAAFAAKHFGSVTPACIVETGDPGSQIVERARKERSSLIMMPTHGRGVFRRLLTGSVAAKVLHDAQTPVWTDAHTAAASRAKKPTKLKKVLCAVDQTDAARGLIEWSAWLAEQYGAGLKVVHVMPAVDEASRNRGEKAVRNYWTARSGTAMLAILKKAGRPGSELVLRGGDIATMLAHTAREEHAGVLVIGRGKLTKTLGRLRTNSLAIVCKSPCPVLSL